MKLTLITLIEYFVFVGLLTYFTTEVIICLLKFQEGIVGVGNREIYQRYVKFPSLSICTESKRNESVPGFDQIKTLNLNNTFLEIKYVLHYENG